MQLLRDYEQASNVINKKIKERDEQIRLVALTGSGISAGSGIPTFRGKDGLWKNYNAMDLATPQAFARDSKLVWEWYAWRINLILERKPNPAHLTLAKLEELGLLKWIITQNVDNLHRRAGSKNILQVHGDIFRAWCQKCGHEEMLLVAPKSSPVCSCGSILRPGVVWFGETLNYDILTKAHDIITKECDVLLIIGTSGLVYPVAAFPVEAKSHGALLIEFNLEPTPITQIADFSIFGKSEETLSEFVTTFMLK